MKKPVIDFIANQLAPGDLATVMYPLTPVDAAVLTRNHQGIINTIEKFEGRKYNYEPINAVEQGYVYKLTPDAIEIIRRQVTFDGDSRPVHQAGIAARRPQVADPDQRGLQRDAAAADAQQPWPAASSARPHGSARDPFAGDNNIMEDRAQFSAGMDMQREMQDVWDACNRNNTAIYAVDPRGLAVGGFDITAKSRCAPARTT